MNTQNSYLASKPHYEILDGLRGVAAVMVVAFHLLEAHSGGNHLEQIINHGYLAVDFFFMLSGYSGYIGRDYAAGNAAGVYAASASFEMGHSRLDRDASAQRTGLVALLRIHRQYSLCIVHPQVQQDSFIRSRCCGGMFYGAPLSYRTCR